MFLVHLSQMETNICLICDVYQKYVNVTNANNYYNLFGKSIKQGREGMEMTHTTHLCPSPYLFEPAALVSNQVEEKSMHSLAYNYKRN